MKKQRIISILTAAIMGTSAAVVPVAPVFPQAIVAEAASDEQTYGSFKYTVSGDAVTITKYTGTGGSVSIPSSINGVYVKKIGKRAFYNTNITYVSIPYRVTEIGNYAFFGCTRLGNFTLPFNLTKIGKDAFGNCTSLSTLTIPSDVTKIDERAFANCTNLLDVNITGAAAINHGAFKGCTKLLNVTLNDGCKRWNNGNDSIPNSQDVFTDCRNLRYINDTTVATIYQDSRFPKLSNNGKIKSAIKKFFLRSERVLFVDQYCSDLVRKLDQSEIDTWMGQNTIARQHHDWVINNCSTWPKNTTCGEARTENDPELNTSDGVLLNYGLYGTGYATDEGYARLYQRLLYFSGLEAYVVEYQNRQWNVVKVKGKYYNVDVSVDDENSSSTENDYSYFLLKKDELRSKWHVSAIYPYTVGNDAQYVNGTYNSNAPDQCKTSFSDSNVDGILDGDWDFNGTAGTSADSNVKAALQRALGYSVSENDIANFFTYLHSAGLSPAQYASQH